MTEPGYMSYARGVVKGDICAGEPICLACARFLRDLERSDLEFRKDKVEWCFSFIRQLKHFKGRASGKPFILEPWQEFIVANIFGFYWVETGDRRFTSSYIEVSRKNGKTALAAALCMYALIADGEDGAEVDLAANSKEQAKIAFEFCSQFSRQLDPPGRTLKPYRDSVTLNANASALKVFAADDSKLDGFNASFGLLDEYHAAKTSKVRDVIKSSMGMRRNPHLCTITTAGFDKTGPCYKLRETAIEILHGLKQDDSIFIAIYSMDEDDDWTDEANWVKCTPNLDVTVTTKYLREQVQSALNNPSEEVGVRTKNLNEWCDVAEVWIPDAVINRSTATVSLDDFKECQCYVGVDLGSVSDMTAVAYLLQKPDEPDRFYVRMDYYLPESALRDSPNKDKYRDWVRAGYMKITPGNVTDYDYITQDILLAAESVLVQIVSYDKYNSTQWAIDATAEGLPLEIYSQAIGNFNRPTKELERLLLSGMMTIDNNEITRWMFRNVALKYDHNGNCKPDKGLGRERKIDGVIALIQALGSYLDNPPFAGEIFAF